MEQATEIDAASCLAATPTAFSYIARPLAIAACLVFSGCGSGYESTVSGNVTLDGKLLDKGTVTFHSVDGGPVAYGRIQADGSYTLNTGDRAGLHSGSYRVTVVANEVIPPKNKLASPNPRRITPQRYGDVKTTDLKTEIGPGANPVDLKLKS